jgi:hypothetical protein
MKSTEISMATLYPSLMGLISQRPKDWPSIERRALMRDAHRIAKSFRASFPSYRQALAYGLSAAWRSAKSRREIQSLAIQAGPITVPLTQKQIDASRRATRCCGSSLWAS